MKKTSTTTCRALAATPNFRFAGLGILLALAVNAEAAMTLNLDLSFDQASIPGSVNFIPGTATGTFTLTGTSFCNGTGEVYGGGYIFTSSWSNIVSSPLPDKTNLKFSLVPQSGTVTYDGGTYAQTSIGTKMWVDSGMGSNFECSVEGAVNVPIDKLAVFSFAGTFTASNDSSEIGADLVSGSFDNWGSGGTFEVTTNITAVPEPASTLSLGTFLASAMFLRTRRRKNVL
jgi:hypothetical protein